MLKHKEYHRLRRHSRGRYRYVRWQWRVLFAVVDFLGGTLFAAVRWLGAIVGGAGCQPARRVSEVPHVRRDRQIGNLPHDDGPRSDPRRILLVQLDHLGDAILSTGFLAGLRWLYPRATIDVLAAPWNRGLFEALPEVDRVFVAARNRFARCGWFGWIGSTLWWGLFFRRRRPDLAIDVRGEFPHAMLMWLSGAPRRLGWDCGGGGFLLTDRPAWKPHRHEADSRMALLAALGMPPEKLDEFRRPRFVPNDVARRMVAARLAEFDASKSGDESPHSKESLGLVVLHVGAGAEAKRWPERHWRSLIDELLSDGARVVLVGAGRESAIARRLTSPSAKRRAGFPARQELASSSDHRLGGLGRPPYETCSRIDSESDTPLVADWTGRLSVVELAALLERAGVLVGPDSAPAHLAAAVGTPAVALFSGTNEPGQWRPCGGRITVLRHPVECSPCHRRRCPRAGHPCMEGLDPGIVVAAVRATRGTGSVAATDADAQETRTAVVPVPLPSIGVGP